MFHILVSKSMLLFSLGSPHRGDSNEYNQRNIILLKIETTCWNYAHLSPDLALWLTLSGSNYPWQGHISMFLKKFNWICIQTYLFERINVENTIKDIQEEPQSKNIA